MPLSGQGWNEVAGRKAYNFIKNSLQHYEYCDISTNTCFEEHLHTAASKNDKKWFLGKATGHNDHYKINMDSQKPVICSNWQTLLIMIIMNLKSYSSASRKGKRIIPKQGWTAATKISDTNCSFYVSKIIPFIDGYGFILIWFSDPDLAINSVTWVNLAFLVSFKNRQFVEWSVEWGRRVRLSVM